MIIKQRTLEEEFQTNLQYLEFHKDEMTEFEKRKFINLIFEVYWRIHIENEKK